MNALKDSRILVGVTGGIAANIVRAAAEPAERRRVDRAAAQHQADRLKGLIVGAAHPDGRLAQRRERVGQVFEYFGTEDRVER